MTTTNTLSKIKNFFTYVGDQGERRRLFYLPIRRLHDRLGYEYWILPLAPFVLAYLIVTRLFMTLWRDLMEVLYLLTHDPYD